MVEINNKTESKINLTVVRQTAEIFLKKHKKQKNELSIAFVGDRLIRRLNETYRGIDKPTDVLTFPDYPAIPPVVIPVPPTAGGIQNLGEIIIDYAQIKRQAREQGHSAQKELIFILVHGLLHLVGYDDATEKGRLEMIRKGEEFIKNLEYRI
ncbi:rRNA maturation RNase YbeY [Candidatus Falkowbacteria bacterium]|nr:rRNA maturation RNase YbeY [Candidatus Falkowbacteria bacterium]